MFHHNLWNWDILVIYPSLFSYSFDLICYSYEGVTFTFLKLKYFFTTHTLQPFLTLISQIRYTVISTCYCDYISTWNSIVDHCFKFYGSFTRVKYLCKLYMSVLWIDYNNMQPSIMTIFIFSNNHLFIINSHRRTITSRWINIDQIRYIIAFIFYNILIV